MDLFSNSQRGAVFSIICQSRRFFLGLGEDVIPSLIEITLKEKMRFLFLPRLAHQLQHSRPFLTVEVGSERSSMVNIAQSDTTLARFPKSQLYDCQLVLLSYSQVDMRKVVIHPQLQNLDTTELLRKL